MRILELFIITIVCAAAQGQQPSYPDDPNHFGTKDYYNPSGLQLGGGVLVTGRPYRGIDSRVIGIPFVMYEDKKWSFKGTRFDYKLSENGQVSAMGLLRLRTEGYDESDSSALRGMDDRDVTLDAGLSFEYKHKWAAMRFDAVTDTLGKNKGQELSISISKPIYKPFDLKKVFITSFAGAEWRTTSLNDYYYGVRPDEAAPGRNPYKASGDTNLFIGMTCNWQIKKDAAIFAMIKNTWLGSEIQDSPIVDKDYTISVIGGVVFNF